MTSTEHWVELLERAAEHVWPRTRCEVGSGSAVHVATSAMRVRVSRLLRACAVLVLAGYASETAGLARSIWEDALSAAYMAESPADRAQGWIDFAEKRRAHHLNWAMARPDGLRPDMLAMLEEASAGLEASRSAWWSGLAPSRMAVSLADSADEASATLARDFDVFYPTLCDEAHGSPFAVDHLLTQGVKGARVDAGPDFEAIGDMPGVALYGAWRFGQAIAAMGGDADEPGLRQVLEHARSLLFPGVL